MAQQLTVVIDESAVLYSCTGKGRCKKYYIHSVDGVHFPDSGDYADLHAMAEAVRAFLARIPEDASAKDRLIRKVQDDYTSSDLCMAELLADEKADGMTVEQAHEAYIQLKEWADGSDALQDKLQVLLERCFNLFHTDLISRAFFDDGISAEDFKAGVAAISVSEMRTDDDEFVPAQFGKV